MKKTPWIALFLLLPSRALGVQEHLGPGVLPTHLIAHILFLSSALFIVLTLKKEKFLRFRYLRIAGIFFLIWNVVTLSLHVISDVLMPRMNIPSIFAVKSPDALSHIHPLHLVQFAGNALEHLLMIFAILFMIFALKELHKSVEERWEA